MFVPLLNETKTIRLFQSVQKMMRLTIIRQMVADFIGSQHTIVNFSDQEAINALTGYYHLESWM